MICLINYGNDRIKKKNVCTKKKDVLWACPMRILGPASLADDTLFL